MPQYESASLGQQRRTQRSFTQSPKSTFFDWSPLDLRTCRSQRETTDAGYRSVKWRHPRCKRNGVWPNSILGNHQRVLSTSVFFEVAGGIPVALLGLIKMLVVAASQIRSRRSSGCWQSRRCSAKETSHYHKIRRQTNKQGPRQRTASLQVPAFLLALRLQRQGSLALCGVVLTGSCTELWVSL